MTESFANAWKEIATSFLKIGTTAYGGPAIMGVMQAEIQERRQWTSKARFLEGLGLVNVLRGALYGLGPVVLAIFVSAVFRLGKSALRSWVHVLIAAGAAAAALLSPLGAAAILIFAGGVGVLLFYSRRAGVLALSIVTLAITLVRVVPWSPLWTPNAAIGGPTLGGVAALFTGLGAFTFGGGLSMIALMQEHVVDRLHWLTPREFVDGLALGQLTPGPIIMVAAYVGYKTLGVTGAAVAAAASFVPSFVLMLT